MIETSSYYIDSVPFADTDASGYVHHTRLIEYMERGRIDLLNRNRVTMDRAVSLGYLLATGSVEVKFIHPVKHGDKLLVFTEVVRKNTAKIITNCSISIIDPVQLDIPCAGGETTTVFMGLNMQPRRLPEILWTDDWKEEDLDEILKGVE